MMLFLKHVKSTIKYPTKLNLKSACFFDKKQYKNSIVRPFLFVTISSLSVIDFESTANTRCEKSPMPPRFGRVIPYHFMVNQKRLFNDSNKIGSNIPTKEDRNECLVCKKYSQGPCGKLFTKWLDCIDENSGKESICDQLVLSLDKCLKQYDEYYDNISIYDNDSDEEVNLDHWKEFILSLESGQEHEIVFKDFPPEIVPQLQIRLQKMIGVIEYHPKILRYGREYNLVLGYAKDNKGNILAAASSDELVEYEGMLILRFHTSNDTQHVKTCGIYMESNDKKSQNNEKVVIYRRTERLQE